MEKEKNESDTNPIDRDKIAENPHLLPYAHHLGSALIKPEDKGRIKGRAVEAMYQQTDQQLAQIRRQIELLAEQAKAIRQRVEISEQIYQATSGFDPIIGRIYYLYKKPDSSHVLSMVSPEEWGINPPYDYLATVRLLADHTWEIAE